MKTTLSVFSGLLLLMSFLCLSSCKDAYDFSKLDKITSTVEVSPNAAVPIAAFSMTFKDLLKEKKDTILYQSDKSIKVIFRKDSVFGFDMSKFFTMPAMDVPTSSYSFEVGVLDVVDYQFGQSVLASQLDQTGFYPTGNITSPAITFPNLLNITTTSSSATTFDYVHLNEGTMSLTLTNNFPLAIKSGLTVELVDKTGTIGFFYFTRIASGANQTQTLSLVNKSVYSSGLKVNLANVILEAGNGTFTKATDGIQLSFTTTGLKADRGSMVLSRKTLADETREIKLSSTEYQIFLLNFKTGQLQFHYQSGISAAVNTAFTFPDLIQNNAVLTKTMTFGNTNGVYKNEYVDFAGGTLDLTKGTGTNPKYNVVRVAYKVSNADPTKYITFSEHDKITFDVSFLDPKIAYLEGYLGTKTYDVEPSTTETGIEFFKELNGGFILTNPSVKMSIVNSIGLPVAATLSLKGESKNNKITVLDKNVSIAVPPKQNPIPETTTEVLLNRDNSTIVDMISYAPKNITYSAKVTSNPANDRTLVNFVSDKSRIKMGVQLELPIELKTANLLIIDTLELGDNDMKEFNKQYTNFEDANVALHLWTSNGFPLDMEFVLTPLNTTTNMTYPSITAQFIESAEVDDKGVVSAVKKAVTKIELTHDDITNISQSNRLIATVRIKTANNGTIPVSMHYDYDLKVKVGLTVSAKGKVNLD